MNRFLVQSMLLISCATALACSGSSEPPASSSNLGGSTQTPAGGVTSTGATTSSSGAGTAAGGALPTGGHSASGGAIATGGQSASGGAIATGAGTAAGGALPTGGRSASGGAIATGGQSASGGAIATGGQSASGGAIATGGRSASGGAIATGGQSASGGAVATGGTVAGGAAGTLPPLHVSGTSILDASNNKVVLRGAATIDVACPYNWSGISDALAQFKASVDLVTTSGWKAQVIRVPVYGSGSTRAGQPNNFPEDGTVSAQDTWFATVLKPAVDYLSGKNLYAIVDWHEISSAAKRDAATKKFWTYMAPKFKNQPNVLYEVFNEDSDTNNWTDWQPLAQGWVDIIRNSGANNVVLVGGPMWAQTIGGSATKPVTGGNIAYVAHIYCSHFNDSWSKGHIETQVAMAGAAAPLFITEWGYASNESNTSAYIDWMKKFESTYGASWTAWVISSSWTPSMFNADKSPTAFGQSVKDWLAQ